MIHKKVVEKHFMFNKFFFFENRAVYEAMLKNLYSRTDHRRQSGVRALHAGYRRPQTHTWNT